jgi:hypothetical protein
VMKDPLIKRIRFVGLRFTREEFEKIEKLKNDSTSTEISEFIRRCIFNKPITVKQRNASLDDFMQVMIALKNELSAIGNNYNQSVRQLNTFKELPAVRHFIVEYEKQHVQIFEKVSAIEEKINQISNIWLQ